MRRLRRWLIPVVLVAVCVGSAHAGGQRVAVVDVQRILAESRAGNAAREVLKRRTRRAREELDRLKSELASLQEQYQSQQAILTDEARSKLEQELLAKRAAFQQRLQAIQLELQQEDAKLTQDILEELKPIIAEVAKARGVSVVLERGEAGVLYVDDALDLTDVVLKRYDKAHAEEER